jgi:ZIP family zinc transporter
MAVGVIFAGIQGDQPLSQLASAMALSVGIALQNIPEGAIISLPLKSTGVKKRKAFFYGAASGAVEPIGALLSYFLTRWIHPLLPWVLSFAAAAMLFVIVEELIPALPGKKKTWGELFFAIGFILMMSLDVLLG